MGIIAMDDQPISATFFGEGRWLTEFITPNALEVQELYRELVVGITTREDRIRILRRWVAGEIKYKPFIKGTLVVEGKRSINKDVWLRPSLTKQIRVGNCANKTFLLASLLRNELSPMEVHAVLGNLHNGKVGGHAWVEVILDDRSYIIESTRLDVKDMVPAHAAERYEAVHYFNDQETYFVEGRTVMEPFSACFSPWLKDYLDWSYIKGGV